MTVARDCAHCGLPLRGRGVRGIVAGEPGAFCCVGCLLALQMTRARGDAGAASSLAIRLGLAVFFAMNVMMTSMPTYVPHVYGGEASLDGPLFALLRVLAALFALPVLAILGGPLARGAVSALRGGRAGSDLLVLLAVVAAYGLSLANALAGRSELYFDTAVMLLILVTVGRWLEADARAEAGRAIREVLAPAPARARRVRPGGADDVDPACLEPGDVVDVAPGEVFPTDGVVEQGEAACDESALTGESRPVPKGPGSEVAGGTCSVDGRLRVRVTTPASASAAARIAAMVDAARRDRAPMERLADRVAGALVPVVLLLAAGAGAWWAAQAGVDRGLGVAIAVLVVACPCALGIATPVAVARGLALAARRGVVVRSAALLERAADAAHVVFDKTGTLTDAAPRVVAVHALAAGPGARADVLARAAALEDGLAHPIARAIAAFAREPAPAGGRATHAVQDVRDLRVLAGRGVRGVVDGAETFVGVPSAADRAALGLGEPDGTLRVVVRDGARALGAIDLAERLRPTALPALAELRALGLRTSVLTGDRTAGALGAHVVPATEVATGLLPADKVARLGALRAELGAAAGRRPGGAGCRAALLMVGDGINDAPALAAADVGIAVAGATDLARLTADVVVLRGDLCDVPWLVAHARHVRRVARQNLAWAFGYNAAAVGLAAAGGLTPLVAALAMLGSSLAVVANARRLRTAVASRDACAAPGEPLPAPGGEQAEALVRAV